MSTGSSGQTELALEPQAWAVALIAALREYDFGPPIRDRDDLPPAMVTQEDLDALGGGRMSATECARLHRTIIMEMLGHGIPIREIRRRLRLSESRFNNLTRGILLGFGDDNVPEMRTAVNVAFDWSINEATKQYRRAGTAIAKMACLRQRSMDLCNKAKLNGLNKPEQIEVTNTKQIGVVLNIVETRAQLPQQEPPRQLEVEQPPPEEAATDGAVDQN